MSIIQSLILGIVQGMTEFLPISSSAHLVLIPYFLNWNLPEAQVFPFDVLVQLGTLLAVILYFWKDLWNIIKAFVLGILAKKPFKDLQSRLGWMIILATIPAGIFGLLLKDKVEAAFQNPVATAIFLLFTALILFLAEKFGQQGKTLTQIKWLDAVIIGLAQACAIFPGISRSGSTIAGAMGRNFKRSDAARFSFLLSIPVMLAAGVISLGDLLAVPNLNQFLPVLVIGFISAALTGYLSIHWLLQYLNHKPLYIFSVYCTAIAVVTLLITYVF